jgi:hypothetical protein
MGSRLRLRGNDAAYQQLRLPRWSAAKLYAIIA